MKYGESSWKKYFFVVAFVLGITPYFWRVLMTEEHGEGVALYLCHSASRLWSVTSRYMPIVVAIYVIGIAALVFFEERNPDRTILWLMTLVFLPIAGIALYMLLGPDFKRVRMRKMFRPSRAYPNAENMDWGRASEKVIEMSTLAYRNSSSPICEHNRIELFFDGEETFAAIKERLRGASNFINIEYYIFEDDRLGRELSEILAERSKAGVAVRMTVDGVGSWKLGRELIKYLQDAGVKFRTFMPVSFPFLHSRLNYRNHRKIIVVDGIAAFTGGFNVGVEYLGGGRLGHWRDTHVMFEGEAVEALNNVFIADWMISSGENPPAPAGKIDPPAGGAYGEYPLTPAQVVPSGGAAWRSVRQMYFRMITGAEMRIWISTPYLIPGEAIMEALRTAALSGIDVRILIPKKSDHFLSHWAGWSNVEDLLRAGVRIWFYKKGFMHSKTLVMDEEVASVGTANLDNRSLDINFEVQTFIYDERISALLASQFLKDLADSEECLLPEWEKRGVRSKILESVGRLWSSQV
jgi:cardiolipin synthase